MKKVFLKQLSAVVFPLIFSACVSQQSTLDFNKQQASKARVELALGYLQQHNFAQAKQNLDKALEHDKNYYLVHTVLAHFYQLQGDVASARTSYLEAIRLDKKQGDTHNNFGTFLCSQGEFKKAFEEFELALSSPHYYRQADTYENMALCAQAANQSDVYQQALHNLRQIDANRAEKLNATK